MKKVVLITGCSTGIGRTLATEFQKKGCKVYATARKLEAIEDLESQQIAVDRLDVTDDQNIAEVVDRINRNETRIDILVNNAGYGLMGPLIETPGEELALQFSTNVFAPMALINQVVPLMISRRSGTIVNIGSVSGVLTTPFSGAYCASKAALHALSDALRMELAPFNIKVVTVQPGTIKSDFGNTATKGIERILSSDSVFGKIESAIRERALVSQQDPTPVEDFAAYVVNALTGPGPIKPVLRFGKKSFLLPFLKKWLPVSMVDKIMSKKFKLDRM